MVESQIRGNSVDPRAELGVAPEVVEFSPGSEHGFLSKILGGCPVANHAHGGGHDECLMAAHEDLERGHIAAPCGIDEFLISPMVQGIDMLGPDTCTAL